MPRHYKGTRRRLPGLRFVARPDDVDQDLLRFFGEGLRAFVAHLGEFFDGTLLDLFVAGLEQLLPNLEEVDALVNLLHEFGGIFRERSFAGRMLARL